MSGGERTGTSGSDRMMTRRRLKVKDRATVRANRAQRRFRESPVSLVYLLERAPTDGEGVKHNERENVGPDSEFDL